MAIKKQKLPFFAEDYNNINVFGAQMDWDWLRVSQWGKWGRNERFEWDIVKVTAGGKA